MQSSVKKRKKDRKSEYLYSGYNTNSPLRHGSHSFNSKLGYTMTALNQQVISYRRNVRLMLVLLDLLVVVIFVVL